jgi:hypothetical protein
MPSFISRSVAGEKSDAMSWPLASTKNKHTGSSELRSVMWMSFGVTATMTPKLPPSRERKNAAAEKGMGHPE